jgi:hypothetical protein
MNEGFKKIPDNIPQRNNDGKSDPLLGMTIPSIMLSSTKERVVLSKNNT